MGFEFRKKTIKLDIANNHFEIEKDKEFDSKVLEFSKEAFKLVEKIKESNNDVEAIQKCCDLCKSTINTLLNDENASDKIFAGVNADMVDHIDVVNYIFDEIGKYNKEQMGKLQDFSRKYNKNSRNFNKKRHKK